MSAKYDAENPAALRRLVAQGTQLRPFSREILDACYKSAQEYYAEEMAKNAKFKKIYEPWKAFLDEEHLWFRVQEQQFDNFMLSRTASKKT
jgi:TRAP-type mannitol/chloroaromatic compound transport system substrate-binding protein